LLRDNFSDLKITLINFNVYSYSGGKIGSENVKYESYDRVFNYKNYFDKIIEIDRTSEVSIRELKRFRSYYKEQVNNFTHILQNEGIIEYLFFFSDKEKPVEILISLAKEMFNSKRILIDEGIVSYIRLSSFREEIFKKFIIFIGGFKYLSRSTHYGRSGMYDYSFSTFPKHSRLKGVKYKLPPIKMDKLLNLFNQPVRKSIQNSLGKSILYVSGASTLTLGKELGRYYLTEDEENNILKEIRNWAKGNNYYMLIKEHPVEHIGKFKNFEGVSIVQDRMIPPEVYFSKGTIILSTTSSTLINSASSGYKTVSIINLCGINNIKPNKILSKAGVYCPRSLKEMFITIENDDAEEFEKDTTENNFMEIFDLS